MLKTAAFGLFTAITVYLLWQVTQFNNQLSEIRQLVNQQIEQPSIREQTTDKSPSSPQENSEWLIAEQSIKKLEGQSKEVQQRLSKLETQLTEIQQVMIAIQSRDISEASTALNLTQSDNQPKGNNSAGQSEPDTEIQQEQRRELFEEVINNPTQIDDEWAGDTQLAIEQTIFDSPDLDAMTATSAVCGTTLCKIETTLPSELNDEEKNMVSWTLLMKVLGDDLSNGTYFINNNADGTQQLTYYLVKNGHQLPTVQ